MTPSVSSGYVAISRRALDLEDYVDVARRHMVWIAGPVFAGLVISIVVAFMVQNTYISQATLQITPAQISESIVKTTSNQALSERINEMEQEILSRASLSSIITDPRLDLYKSERASGTLEDVIETMKNRDIRIQVDSVPGERRASALSISFAYRDRVKAHDTVQTLITKLVEANLNSQRTQQQMVGSLVHDLLSEAKAKLDKLDEEMNRFRAENAGKLPEQESLNMAQMTSLQQRLSSINDALNRDAQDRVQIDARLATLENQKALSESLDNETDVSAPALRQNERLIDMNKRIADTETSLAQLRQTYKPSFPDIRDAEGRLDILRRQRDELQKQQDEDQAKPVAAPKKAINFKRAEAVSNLDAQISAAQALAKALEMRVVTEKKDQDTAAKQLETYQTRLAATSGIEAKYADLMHESQQAREKYQVLQNNQQLAEQNGELLSRQAAEHLDVLDPPSLPTQPAQPKRWMYIGGGTAAGFILGLALAGLQEAKDTSLKNLKDVRAYTNLPVLSSIPLLENTILVRRKRRVAYLAWSAAVIVGILAVSASLYYHYTYAV
jgi:succinoglycan biosynthesis transport protein ExoP